MQAEKLEYLGYQNNQHMLLNLQTGEVFPYIKANDNEQIEKPITLFLLICVAILTAYTIGEIWYHSIVWLSNFMHGV